VLKDRSSLSALDIFRFLFSETLLRKVWFGAALDDS
jgi:hypothetical protein